MLSILCRRRVNLPKLWTRQWAASSSSSSSVSWSDLTKSQDRPSWSQEWKNLGLGADLIDGVFPEHLFFVQVGFGVDQHGSNDATKAAIRAVRNAIEFNSIPGVISHLPGGRKNMIIHVKLGIPCLEGEKDLLPINHLEVAKVFPYGKLLPFHTSVGGLSFPTGRVVEDLGDENDSAICVAACVSLGYGSTDNAQHISYSTRQGY